MKKRLIALCVLAIICVALCACGKKDNKLSAMESVIKLDAGKTYTIELKNGDAEALEWSSDDESIATVSENGVVTGKHDGVTVISGKTENGFLHIGVIVEGKEEYVDKNGNVVKIYNEQSNITAITVGVKGGGKNDVTIKKGDTYTLVAYTEPESSDKIDWKSENTAVVSVNKDGVISAVGKGMTKVIAYAPNGVKGEMILRVN